MSLIQGLFEGFGCLGFPQSLEIGDRLDCGFTRLIGAHEWQWLVRSVLGFLLMGELSEAANDHAAAHRHREPTFAPAQSSSLHSVNIAIALSQALASAEAISRAVAYAQGPAAVQAAWRIVDEPEFLFPAAASRTDEIGPRAAVLEFRMGDADAFAASAAMVLLAKGDDALPVLKPDRARGLQARYAPANKSVEENAVTRIDRAFRHEL